MSRARLHGSMTLYSTGNATTSEKIFSGVVHLVIKHTDTLELGYDEDDVNSVIPVTGR